jgi:hypothetical protein
MKEGKWEGIKWKHQEGDEKAAGLCVGDEDWYE